MQDNAVDSGAFINGLNWCADTCELKKDDITIIDESRRPYVDLKNFQSILHLVVHTYRIIYCLQLYKCAIMYYY